MKRNSRCSSFVRMRNPTPLFSLGLWRNKTIMATLEEKAFCVLQFAKHESVVSVQRAFRRQFNNDPPSPNSIRRWYQQFRQRGAFVKKKVQDGRVCQKKAWNDWDSLSLTLCDYFLWGYVKDKVFVPPQPVSIPDLKNRITAAVETITPDLLIRGGVWGWQVGRPPQSPLLRGPRASGLNSRAKSRKLI